MNNTITKYLLIMTVLLVAGCANNDKQIYAWGQYEDLIYDFHNGEGAVEPQKQIELLQEAIASASVKNKKVAPGIYAHLGMLYSSVGENDKARVALEQERALFPEAEVFINGMLKRSQATK
jgi:hypothetical protein